MIELLLLLAGPPDLSRLGADSFDVREAEERRCDGFLRAALLPSSHDDPEVDHRVKRLRQRNLRWLRWEYAERMALRHDFGLWLDLYFLPGRSGVAMVDVYAELRADWQRAEALAARWGVPAYDVWRCDLADFGDLCDFHRRVAPMPREAGRP